MRSSTVLRRRTGVVAGIFVLLFGGGVAVASWTATGTGQGSAQAASVSGLVVTAGSPLGALYRLQADTTPATGYGSGLLDGHRDRAGIRAGGQTCTDSTTLNLGSVQYTVTPVHGRWVGNPSAASTPVL